jgi:hypothetical protein
MTQPNLISVLSSSSACIGYLRSAGPRGFTAYDGDGQPLGPFAEKQAAVERIGVGRIDVSVAQKTHSKILIPIPRRGSNKG